MPTCLTPPARRNTAIHLIAAAAAALLCGPAAAVSVVQNISYNQPNLSPWSQGSAFTLDWSKSYGGSLNFNVPTVDLSLSGLLAGFLGLPKIGFVESSVSGQAGAWLDVGYYVSGGRMNLQYPGQGRLDFGGAGPGRFGTLNTAFVPGLTRAVKSSSAQALSTLLGSGYDPDNSLPGFAWDRYKAPTFATSFPTASAWAQVRYDVRADLGVTAGVARAFGECLLCKRFSAEVSAADTIPLLSIDRTGVEVLGKRALPLFGQDFSIGVVSARLDYPDLKVQGGLKADGVTLAGRDARSVLSFNAPLEQLVPVLGPILSPKIGPFEATLLSVAGGPSFGLYQDFEVAVQPKVQLDFGTQVQFRRNGQRSFGRSITLDLGEDIDWKPVMNFSGTVRVQPTWLLDGTIRNETGIAIGAQLSVDALKLQIPPLPTIGPVKIARITEPDLVSIPLYAPDPFAITRTAVVGAPVDVPVQVGSTHRASLSTRLLRALPLDGVGAGESDWYLTFGIDDASFTTHVRGRASGVLVGGGFNTDFQVFDTVLETLEPVRVKIGFAGLFDAGNDETLDLGTLFCVRCSDRSAQLVDQGNWLADGDDRLYMNRLDDYGTDLGVARAVSTLPFDPLAVAIESSVVAVPEPGSWALMAGGLLAVAGVAARHRRSSPDAA